MCSRDIRAPIILVFGEAEFVISALKNQGVQVVPQKRNYDIAVPVAYHPDMQFFFFPDGHAVTLLGNEIPDAFREMLCPILFTGKRPDRQYPGDVLCNAFYHAGAIYARLDSLDESILAYAREKKLALISVRQGYAACSVCTVNDEAVITADSGLAEACRRRGTDVLEIAAGQIKLPGYAYGFIGGCSGRIDDQTIAFTGSLDSHTDGIRIRNFIRRHHMDVLELSKGPLVDIGGMIDIRPVFKTFHGHNDLQTQLLIE